MYSCSTAPDKRLLRASVDQVPCHSETGINRVFSPVQWGQTEGAGACLCGFGNRIPRNGRLVNQVPARKPAGFARCFESGCLHSERPVSLDAILSMSLF